MKRDIDIKRLKYIKAKKPLFWKQCRCCGKEYRLEPMFKVDRWGVNQSFHTWWYCQHCMPTKQDVLNEIDSDECCFGIAIVDSFFGYQKKDNTRIHKQLEDILDLRNKTVSK